MLKLNEIIENFRKKPGSEEHINTTSSQPKSTNAVKQVKNWYEERYDNITVQRNLLFVLLLVLLCLSIVSITVAGYVIHSKRFDPFVIQIDDTTGMAKVVNPINSSILNGNEALAQFFIKKYIIARESYNPVDFDTEAMKTVRLLSSNSVYWIYRGYLKTDDMNPALKYGQKNTTFLIIKSWSKLADQKYMVRFSVNETAGNRSVFNKLAIIEFAYLPMELTDSDRDINPIGFQVTGYRVDNDNS